MKRFGFTLTEVLITLSIVGIIAALTIPSMTQNVSKQQVGPALAKAVNNLENANRKVLADQGAIRLSDIDDNYFNILSMILNGDLDNATSPTKFITNDGIHYYNKNFTFKGASGATNTTVTIDLNGNKKPNVSGVDQFEVTVDPSGEITLGSDAAAVKKNGWELQ